MTREQYDRIMRVFKEARAFPAVERAAHVAASCADDDDVVGFGDLLIVLADRGAVRVGGAFTVDSGQRQTNQTWVSEEGRYTCARNARWRSRARVKRGMSDGSSASEVNGWGEVLRVRNFTPICVLLMMTHPGCQSTPIGGASEAAECPPEWAIPKTTSHSSRGVDLSELYDRAARLQGDRSYPENNRYRPMGDRPNLEEIEQGDESFEVVPVFFGSSRENNGSGRSSRLVLGQCLVSIPRVHVRGELEEAGWFEGSSAFHHVVLMRTNTWSETRFIAAVDEWIDTKSMEGDVVVYVHGYNVGFDDAVRRAAQLWYDLDIDALCATYTWPSRGEAEDYLQDRNDAEWAVTDLERFLDLLVERTSARRIHLIGHSTGVWMLTQTLRLMGREREQPRRLTPPFHHVVLAAGDIDQQSFARAVDDVLLVCRRLSIYASSHDKALKLAGGLQDSLRLGQGGHDDILVLPHRRVDSVDASEVTSYIFSFNHSYYAESAELLDDLAGLLKWSASADRRSLLSPRLKGDGRYYMLTRSW